MDEVQFRAIFWISMAVAMMLSFILFVGLTDAGQFLSIPRSAFITLWSYRILIFSIALVALTITWIVYDKDREVVPAALFVVLNFAWIFFMLNALLLSTYILFKPQPDPEDVTYLNFDAADMLYGANDDVMVLAVNGKSAAYPRYEIGSPHIAGIRLGDEEISVSFCGLRNLGVAFSPGKGKTHYDLGIVGQSNNNLIMYDKRTGELIQQISAKFESSNSPLSERPTLRMSYGNYKKAFPDGRVYNNSESTPLVRKIVSDAFFFVAEYFMEQDDLAFPYRYTNDALTGKDIVYALNIDDDYVAYTEDFIMREGGIINTSIGGKGIVIAYSDEYDSIVAFYSDQYIAEVDLYGNSNVGKLERVSSFKSKVYWGVWQHYFPDTALNRL